MNKIPIFITVIIGAYILFLLEHIESPFAPLAETLAFYVFGRVCAKIFSGVFFDERIQWPDSLIKIKKLYFAMARGLSILFNTGMAFLVLLLVYKLYSGAAYKELEYGFDFLLLETYFFFASYLTFSLCWYLHDRWAEGNDAVSISALVDAKVKAGKRPTCYDWLVFDGIFLFAIGCALNKQASPMSMEEALVCGGILFILLATFAFHGWLWFKYKDA